MVFYSFLLTGLNYDVMQLKKKLRNFPILVIYEVIRDDMLENF